jgi:two-component system, chemotaxis family, sensor kinase CheA
MTSGDLAASRDRFINEAWEHLEQMDAALVQIESNPADGPVLEGLCRSLHTLKGAANMMGFTDVGAICHRAEDLLDQAQQGGSKLTASTVDVLLDATDWVKVALGKLAGGESQGLNTDEICTALADATADMASAHAGTTDEPEHAISGSVTATPGESVSIPVSSSPAEPEIIQQDDTLRISTAKVDTVVRLAGEAMSGGAQLLHRLDQLRSLRQHARREWHELRRQAVMAGLDEQLARSLTKNQEFSTATGALYAELREGVAALSQTTSELQSSSLEIRMLPLSLIFQHLPRAVRGLSRAMQKELHLQIEGGETQLDKQMADRIGEVVLHLVRNAVDHGLETAADRRGSGKPAQGSLRIGASLRGDQVVIEVQDDGRGIDREAVIAKAIERQLIDATAAQESSSQAVFGLLFEPGFSTASRATEVSGRGVGLDVVKNRLDELSGSIEVESWPGRGTLFTLRIPASLTTQRVLIIQSGAYYLALPMESLEETMRLTPERVERLGPYRGFNLRDRFVPLVSLPEILGDEESRADGDYEHGFVVVLVTGGHMVALAVDALIDERDALIEPLPTFVRRSSAFASGVTVFRYDQVAYLVHPQALADVLRRHLRDWEVHAWGRDTPAARRRILIAEDSASTRQALQEILQHADYQVDSAVDGREALQRVQDTRYDLLISDLDMPRLDGFGLVQKLRSEPRTRSMPILIITSRTGTESQQRAIRCGANGYLSKSSFVKSAFLEQVVSLLG